MNLRGEYHTENVTTFDTIANDAISEADDMDVDMPDVMATNSVAETQKQPVAEGDAKSAEQDVTKIPKVTVSQSSDQTGERSLNLDTLYPIFWGLQAYFSSPTKIFDAQHFATFKSGLEATLNAFRTVNTELETSNSKTQEELRKSTKRKRTADGPEIASSFNPKYLTSRELFDLEVFSMNILVFFQ